MTTLFISHSSKDNDWARELQKFLQNTNRPYEAPFLDTDKKHGLYPGVKWERELYRQLRKARCLIGICTKNWLKSHWCVAEAMLAREKNKPVILLVDKDVATTTPAAGEAMPTASVYEFLKDRQFISLKGQTRKQAHKALLDALAKIENPQDHYELPDRPYPGLRPFTTDDAGVFYGRDEEVETVCGELQKCGTEDAKRFLLVLGASGSGKSSLVRAGVVPRLTVERIPESKKEAEKLRRGREWVVPKPFLGRDGLAGLSESLVYACQAAGQSGEKYTSEHMDELLASARGSEPGIEIAADKLDKFARSLLVDVFKAPDARLLLILDQLEEVFSTNNVMHGQTREASSGELTTDGPQAARAREGKTLLSLLLAASAGYHAKIVVLATMRSDFTNEFQNFPGAATQYESVLLDPMRTERFVEVIRGPAARFDIEFDPEGLPEILVADAKTDDALPLLAHALEQLYAACGKQSPLTEKAYKGAFGKVTYKDRRTNKEHTFYGVTASIKKTADGILSKKGINPSQTDNTLVQAVRQAFVQLVKIGESQQFTRRVASWSEVPEAAQPVLNEFVKRRLLTTGLRPSTDGGHDAETVTVAHEALFRVWDVLAGWLESARDALAVRNQIRTAARVWQKDHCLESRLWTDERVIDAVKEIAKSGLTLRDDDDAKDMIAFLGPTDLSELEALPSRRTDQGNDYGDWWRAPLSHAARAKVGDRLALLADPHCGDRRPGVGLGAEGLPEIDWCEVVPRDGRETETVTIKIRDDENDPDSPYHTESQEVSRFSIARYPVTVKQFRSFLDQCYKEGHWELPAHLVKPGENYAPPEPRASHVNQPVDNVNWFDGYWFCGWLTEVLREDDAVRRRLRVPDEFVIRLPTEFEWQLAATGGDPDRDYPWGKVWLPEDEAWRANTVESKLGRSTAVGLYPRGAAPCGALDMAGTLWEWCLNNFDAPADRNFPADFRTDRRVLRGGSWNGDRDFARAACRDYSHPYYRGGRGGFRVVCASPID